MGSTMDDAAMLALVRDAFASCPRPERFTNHPYCRECVDHHQTLASRDLDTLKVAREADEAIYVAIGGITDKARRYAAEHRIRLIEGAALAQLLRGRLPPK